MLVIPQLGGGGIKSMIHINYYFYVVPKGSLEASHFIFLSSFIYCGSYVLIAIRKHDHLPNRSDVWF